MNFTNDFEKREFIAREALKELKELYPNYFKFDLQFTTDTYAAYDAFYHIIDVNTHSIKKRVLIELKIRDTIYDDYMLETKKMNSLLKLKKELGDDTVILYINFCKNETLIWNIDDVKDKPVSKIRANKATSLSRTDKVDKSIILLNKVDGKSLNYILDADQIIKKKTIQKIINVRVDQIKNDLFKTLFG